MNRTRWLMTISLGLVPMLASMGVQGSVGNLKLSLSAAASSSSNAGAKSGGKSSSNSSSSNSTSSSSTNSSSSTGSSSSSSSSAVSVGVAPKAKVTNPHGPISIPCANCHSYTSWKPIRSKPEFDHSLTGYPLRGMHQNVGCTQCHTSMVFKNVGSQCSDCHADLHKRQFGANCSQCHTVRGWQVSMQAIKNHSNRFPLVGGHSVVQCEQCHKQAAVGQFVGLPTSCYSCHQQDFLTPVLDHVGLRLPNTCESCHSLDSWFNAKFDHLKYTGYALTGAHATLPCASCHINNVFKGTSAQCYSCHQADFNNSNNPSHVKMGLPRDCAICHSTVDWSNAKFDHALYAKYPLTGKHAAVECKQCHTNNNYNNTPTDCYSCHQADFQRADNPPHASGGFPTDCSLCHTTAGWQTSTFNHDTTKFPLTGAHGTVQCAQCHINSNYSGSLPTDCFGCHQTDYNKTDAPPHAALASMFPTAACATCHTTAKWDGAPFDHSKTKYPLTGKHVTVECAQCHVGKDYLTRPMDCVGCHQTDYDTTTNPNHKAANYPTTCASCHNTASWLGSGFDHSKTGFPLTGAHVTVTCVLCHVKNNYSLTAANTACTACHMNDYNGTTAPPHAKMASMFPASACATCHTTTSWDGAPFDHNKTTFRLTGTHVTVPCAQCHVGNDYLTRPTDCYGCHKTDYDTTAYPNHKAANYPTTCTTCHNTTSWATSAFNHNSTGFPLTGAHVTVTCVLCHVNNNYSLTAANTACTACHMNDYNKTDAPPHAQLASMFPASACATCHTTTKWDGAPFDHNKTSYPLTGKHVTVQCAQCHVGNDYLHRPTDCFGCHQTDYNGTTNPNHLAANYPTSCTACHNTSSWLNSTFNHNSTGFPLTGAHVSVNCVQCHVNNNYNLTAANAVCTACHMNDYNKTDAPPHAQLASMFPASACATCHTTTKWDGAPFDHNKTSYPLTGKHVTVQCAQCHVGKDYLHRPTDCVGCHQTDYDTTASPNHKAAHYPTTCATCHNTASWATSAFNHNSTGFPLTGAHVSVNCVLCHVNNNYNLTAANTTCISCHQADFAGASSPPHAGFPTNCTVCHGAAPLLWTTATFNHSGPPANFPLVGAHTALQCVQCHVNNNYNLTPANAVCSACHMSDYNGTKNPPHAQLATMFPASACATCHTTTNWDGAPFDHNKTSYPLTGKHVTVQCAQCHVGNDYLHRPTDCFGCHQNDYDTTASPNHKAAHYPTTCTTCHNTASWVTSSFDHSQTGFPLTGAHVSVNCVLCHVNNNYNLTAANTTCISCHQADFAGASSPPHAGFPTNCTVCHGAAPLLWTTATFNHSGPPANFPLVGAHTALQCVQCHVNNNYNLTPANAVCSACHMSDYNGTKNPPHAQLATMFPASACATCHTTTNWDGAPFDHNKTSYPLTGKHVTVQCAQCHVGNDYLHRPTDCFGCHQNDYNTTASPNHLAAKYPTTCTTCHTTSSWLTSNFNHSQTGFPLTGAHVSVNCVLCHVNNNYNLTAANTTCISCHQADFAGASSPPHTGFPTDCTVCHGAAPLLWTTATFNHSGPPANFPLVGAHTALQCVQCHVNNNYNLTPANTTCISCHQANFAGASSPPHTGFPTDCTVCHGAAPRDWSSATFNHSGPPANFPLVGAHTALQCVQCHANNNYNLTPANTTCISCHQANFAGASSPPHTGFPTDCTVCHGAAPRDWSSATFNHSGPPANFPLVGAHTALQCVQCHVNNNYNLTPANATCISCHQANFAGASSPPHTGFPTDCTVCHGAAPRDWSSATFNHSGPPANFPLVGAHTALQCVQCHVNNNYNLTPANTTCISCHQANFAGASSPPHTGFPTDCTTCHGAAPPDWTTATFNHSGPPANFPLTGFHATMQCMQCHVNNNYNLTAANTTCISCHQTDFNNATTPQPHTGFPTDCTMCHTTANWTSATFNHSTTGFTLTGAHVNGACTSCHVNNNYSLTAAQALCSNCHMTDYNGTTNPNHATAGFPTTCDTCHTTTNWNGATFNHNNTPFPLTGEHVNVACTACHINNVFAGTPTDCYSCHTKDYNGTTNPNHAAAKWPTTCDTCHTITKGWPATLPASYHTFFNVNHGNAKGVCTTCHTNSSDYSVFTCTGCHGGNNAANFHHPNVNGYQYLSTACLACHKNGGGG